MVVGSKVTLKAALSLVVLKYQGLGCWLQRHLEVLVLVIVLLA